MMIDRNGTPGGLYSTSDAAPWTREDDALLQTRLIPLLSLQMRRKTLGDCDSLREEEVTELLDSIRFTLDFHLKANALPSRILLEHPLEATFRDAQETLRACVTETETLYDELLKSVLIFGNRALNDTLKGIAPFFLTYDYRLYACRIPASIDYPLCFPVSETLQGVAFIREYLLRLQTENTLLRRFNPVRVMALIRRVHPDYEELVMNLFEPVAACMIGLSLLGDGEMLLDMTTLQADCISERFEAFTPSQAHAVLRRAAEAACLRLSLTQPILQSYLAQTASALYPRLTASPLAARGVFAVVMALSP
jgi:hypothetical protein